MKNLINIKFLLVVTGLLCPVFHMSCSLLNAQHLWTYEECLQYAIDHNINIQQRALDIKMQENERNTADNEWLPAVTLNAGQQFSFGNAFAATGTMPPSTDNYDADLSYTSASVGLEMPVFNGFRTKNRKLSARYSLEQATANMQFAHKSLSIQIATYYLQALYEKGMVKVAEEQVVTSQKLCERAHALVEDGRNPKSDLAEAEAQLADDEYQLTIHRGQERIALLTLAQLLNLEQTDGFAIADMDVAVTSQLSPNASSQAIYDEIAENYPSVRAAKAAVEQGKSDIATARADYWPQLTLKMSLNDYYLNFFHQSPANKFGDAVWKNFNEVVGLHLTMPLFDRFRTRNNIRRAKLSLNRSQLELDNTRQQLRKEIEQAYYNTVNAQEKYVSAQKSLEASILSSNYESDKYEAGRSSIYDLTQAQQRLRRASENTIQAKYELIIRQKILDVYKFE